MTTAARRQRERKRERGFTLVELLAVVAMVGILAALAVVGYRKFMTSAGSAEAVAVMQGIRGAEEAYKAEMLVYLGCSASLSSWYPMANPGPEKHHWVNPGHGEYNCWRQLNVVTDGPVRFGYAVVAGMPPTIGAALPAGFTDPPVFPAVTEPWYIVTARGDRDGDGVPALFIASSLKGEVYKENDSE